MGMTRDSEPWLLCDGWLACARHVPSPNANARPAGTVVDLIVIHNISLPPGCFGGDHVTELFCNTLDNDAHAFFAEIAQLRVSAHFFIDRGGIVSQYVATQDRAWHAGVSQWCGRDNCNDFSIGIELEGTDDTPYSAQQYRQLARLIQCLRREYPHIPANAIVGHSDIAPGRKTDPGPAFDWQRLHRALT